MKALRAGLNSSSSHRWPPGLSSPTFAVEDASDSSSALPGVWKLFWCSHITYFDGRMCSAVFSSRCAFIPLMFVCFIRFDNESDQKQESLFGLYLDVKWPSLVQTDTRTHTQAHSGWMLQRVIDNSFIPTLICCVNSLHSSGKPFKMTLRGFGHRSIIARSSGAVGWWGAARSHFQFIPEVLERAEVRAPRQAPPHQSKRLLLRSQ